MKEVSTISKRKSRSRPQNRRQQPRPVNKGYGDAGASWHKKATKGFRAMSGSPKEDIDANNYTLRQRARMLYMAAPIATSAIRTNRTNVVGIGLQLKSRIDREALGMTQEAADAWQAQAEREFALWSENKRACDATGVNNFAAMQQLALSSWLVSGDVFAVVKQYEPTLLTPYSLRLHLIEADRVATPTTSGIITPMLLTTGKAANGNTIYDGVEVNGDGQIEAYHIRSTYPFELGSTTTTWARVQAYGERTGLPNILHVMESERPDQYRGVSYLAQVIEPLLQLRRYTESELTAAVVESFFTAFIKTEAGAGDNPFNEVGSSLPEVSRDPNEYEMGPGQINIMEPGEDVTFADPKRPASGFNTFLRAICEQVGAALEIPADLLLKSFNSSYSASRAALMEAWKAFRMRRKWFVDDFCTPVYEIWLSEAVARGRISARASSQIRRSAPHTSAPSGSAPLRDSSTRRRRSRPRSSPSAKASRPESRRPSDSTAVSGTPTSTSSLGKTRNCAQRRGRSTRAQRPAARSPQLCGRRSSPRPSKASRKETSMRTHNTPRLCAGPQTAGTPIKFWNVASIGDDEGEITLYGDVVSRQPVDWWTGEPEPGLYIAPESFMEDLAAVKGKSNITIKINSCGGDLYTGIAIHNAIKGLTGHKVVVVEGIAASAASVIACAGDEVQVYPGSMVMIHGVAGLLYDYYTLADLKKLQKDFDASERAIAEIYHAKTGIEVDQLRSMMTRETWMVGQEAIDNGFADTLLTDEGPDVTLSADKKVLLVAGIRHDVKGFRHIPGTIPIDNSIHAAPAAGNKPAAAKNDGPKKEDNKTMTLEEMRAQHPDVVAQIEQQAAETARTQERARIEAIDSIAASVGDAQLVRDAKYGETPCTAEQLALKAMQKQAALGAKHLKDAKADNDESGAAGVGAAPNGGEEGSENDDKAKVDAIVGLYNSTKSQNGGKK